VNFLPNAISVRSYQPIAEKRIAEDGKDGPIHILYLGYLGRAKGSFDLIDAANKLRAKGATASFDLVGDELTPGEGKC
jgi:glycosyltransferase involved in cell wall biosynthesis